MTSRERERQTLEFQRLKERGAVEETFFPWGLAVDRFKTEGIPAGIADGAKDMSHNNSAEEKQRETYLAVDWGEGVLAYEQYLGFDPVRRAHFILPFRGFEEKLLSEDENFIFRQDMCGRVIKRNKRNDLETIEQPIIKTAADWETLKEHAEQELETWFTDKAIDAKFAPLREGHERGDYSIRLDIEGFFWIPRDLLGVEPHMYAFYDEPELLHDINQFALRVFLTRLLRVIDLIKPDVLYMIEDLSGKNGPMISGALFDEFVGDYYRQLVPVLKEHGVGNVFIDTDGDFAQLIPNFMAAGIDGFMPMDVNAGMDIVKVRRDFPTLKFIGGFNKLCIAQGREAIDREFQRILPVIRSGGYIPGADHQVAPSTSLADYRYYIKRLAEMMEQAGADLS